MRQLEKILDAWWHSETLSPKEIPKLNSYINNQYTKNPIKKVQRIYSGQTKIPSEWTNTPFEQEEKTHKIGLYGNCYKEYELIEFQREIHKVKDEIHNKSNKTCYGFYVEFDENNTYIKDSLFVPHVNLYIKLASDNKNSFDERFFEVYKDAINYLNGQAESINGGSFSEDWLIQFISEYERNFAKPPINKEKEHYLELLVFTSETELTPKFNSFFSEDILKAKEDMNTTIRQYLSKPAKKIDINENRKFIEKLLYPINIPLGRWPSPIDHRSSLMQQVAVNEFFSTSSAISSVNGPPGTGKTTLLKDIFAEIVVQKALAMLAFRKDPSKALIKTGYKVQIKNRFSDEKELVYRYVYNINPTISQYAAVVASSNNTAVENISKDLPKLTEIDEEFKNELKPLNYAKKISEKITGAESWGMFSLPLGKGENIKKAAAYLAGEDFSVLSSLNFSSQRKSADHKKKEWEIACDEFQALYKEVKKIRKSLAHSVKFKNFINKDENFIDSTSSFWAPEQYEYRQQNVLYQTNTLNKKRSILFLKALAVLRHFLTVNQGKLDAALSLLENKNDININSDDAIEAIKAMWNTVHCICPVISTTFASFSSMYRGMPKDFIPYLFIDEAGQATPLQAVGALWRSKKVLVVGDPLQIEPVQTLHPSVIEDIRKIYQIDEEVFNVKSSVQSVADRANRHGTYISPDQWIGIPLWVHRRCVEPMFSISNNLAYNGKMVLADNKKEYGKGEWLHCVGEVTKDQYVPQQTEVLDNHVKGRMANVVKKQLIETIKKNLGSEDSLEHLFEMKETIKEVEDTWSLNKKKSFKLMGKYLELRQGRLSPEIKNEIQQMQKGTFSCPSIYIITPFSTVKNELKKALKAGLFDRMYKWLNIAITVKGTDEEAFELENTFKQEAKKFKEWYNSWLDKNIGTVHTFQGKEADIVYFVTGTDSSKITAAEWACNEPNLLNVAATRAKKEFYIIGDRNLLEKFPNYKKIINVMENSRDGVQDGLKYL
ncbi:AAA domain-containing protein [Bacillus spizizenii]|uniref:DEAD/DEAH box helicase n=1 Tax=Bacillus spizizenii TaxID=96241 RepID=UPI0015901F26|nr:AAA domain-containing protein [Bacillus spizizenii]